MKKFSENQVFTNFLKAHPRLRVDFYSASAYYNERPAQGQNVPADSLSLYEINVDRQTNNLIYPFVIKDAAKNSFSVTATSAYSALNPGATITGSYPLTSSITRQYPMSTAYKRALKNTLNYYKFLSPYYAYEYYDQEATNLISIPSIFYGEGIKKGSVKLSIYFTGSLVARAEDRGNNGALIQTYGTASLSGSTVGTVLYNEGFILLSSSAELSTNADDSYDSDSPDSAPKWIYFGPNTGATPPNSASFVLEFKGTNTIPVMTMFCEAGKNEYNFSNNPTYIASSSIKAVDFQGRGFSQPTGSLIKNTVKSDFTNATEPFAPVTYISKIGIYDDNKNLIAIAKLARPVKKDEEDGYTFKVNIDL